MGSPSGAPGALEMQAPPPASPQLQKAARMARVGGAPCECLEMQGPWALRPASSALSVRQTAVCCRSGGCDCEQWETGRWSDPALEEPGERRPSTSCPLPPSLPAPLLSRGRCGTVCRSLVGTPDTRRKWGVVTRIVEGTLD